MDDGSRTASPVAAGYTPESGGHGSALGTRNASRLVLGSIAQRVIAAYKRPSTTQGFSVGAGPSEGDMGGEIQ